MMLPALKVSKVALECLRVNVLLSGDTFGGPNILS